MCGIVGSFGKLDFVRFKKSLDSIKHLYVSNLAMILVKIQQYK